MDQHLTWNEHIRSISDKIAKSIGILTRTAYLLPSCIRLKLYYSLVYPYLTYCNMVWASTYDSRLRRLMILQKRAVRVIAGVPRCVHSGPLFTNLRLLKLEQIRTLQIGLFMYRYEHGLLPACFKVFFHLGSDVHTHYTRNCKAYRPVYAHTNTRLFSIKSVGSTTWNMLPSHIRRAPHLMHFKKMLHAFLINGT